VHGRRPPDGIILDMDSSESPMRARIGSIAACSSTAAASAAWSSPCGSAAGER
jgi:hypothetical protein